MKERGKHILSLAKRAAGKTEKEIYSALNRKYKEPWER